MTAAFAIFPIAIVFFIGWLAKITGLLKAEHWSGIEALSFRLLIPVLLVVTIGTAELDPTKIGPLALAMVAVVVIASVMSLALRLIFSRDNLSDASLSTLFQTTTRWNAFVSLGAAELLAGPEVLLFIAVSMAVLIPIINIGNVVVLAWLCAGSATLSGIFKAIVKNPLVIGSVLGLALNFAAFELPETAIRSLEIIGRAALGIGLLVVGAGISFKRLSAPNAPTLVGALLRPAILPFVFIAISNILSLPPEQVLAGILVTAVPAASNGYVVAKAMGGDADLYADIQVWQILLTVIAIPFYAAWVL